MVTSVVRNKMSQVSCFMSAIMFYGFFYQTRASLFDYTCPTSLALFLSFFSGKSCISTTCGQIAGQLPDIKNISKHFETLWIIKIRIQRVIIDLVYNPRSLVNKLTAFSIVMVVYGEILCGLQLKFLLQNHKWSLGSFGSKVELMIHS